MTSFFLLAIELISPHQTLTSIILVLRYLHCRTSLRHLLSVPSNPFHLIYKFKYYSFQEGPRYNALHIAAKHNRPLIADFILKTVGNKSFCQQLYGSAGDNSYLVRPEVMLDLYLNTPDKALNETPLHFAAKYGAYDVVLVFVQYPQLQLHVKNKYGQTPKDVITNVFLL